MQVRAYVRVSCLHCLVLLLFCDSSKDTRQVVHTLSCPEGKDSALPPSGEGKHLHEMLVLYTPTFCLSINTGCTVL